MFLNWTLIESIIGLSSITSMAECDRKIISRRVVPDLGKPIIKGTRISVYDVLNWMANGMSKEEILNDFPELSLEMINACLAFAADKESKIRIAS